MQDACSDQETVSGQLDHLMKLTVEISEIMNETSGPRTTPEAKPEAARPSVVLDDLKHRLSDLHRILYGVREQAQRFLNQYR